MSLQPSKPRRNPGVSLVAHSNVGYWAQGTPCPFASKKMLMVLSYDPDRPKGKKTTYEELQLEDLEPPLWFTISQSKKAIVLSEDDVKSIKFKDFEKAALRESGNVVCEVERTLKNGNKETYSIPPMHSELFDNIIATSSKKKGKKKAKRSRAKEVGEMEVVKTKKSKPLEEPAKDPPPPISHIADPDILDVFDWTGCHGLYSIAKAVGHEGLAALENMLQGKEDLDPHEIFDSWYSDYWMPGLLKLKTLPFAKECPLSIIPERRLVALDCLKNGFVIILHIYRNLEVNTDTPPFVQTAIRDWAMFRTLPITEWVLTGPGLKNAKTWDKGMKTASTPPGKNMTYPEYGCATVLGMFLAFGFYASYAKPNPGL